MVSKYTYLSLFATNPERQFSLQEFEDYFKTPHQTIKKYLNILVKQRIINEDKRKRFIFYSLNLANPEIYDALSICEKLRLKKRLFDDLLLDELYEKLSPHFNQNIVIIFGSATNSSKYNDIDLLVTGKTTNIKKTTDLFEQKFNKEIHFHSSELRDLSEIFRRELIKKHIILNNHDSVIRELY